MPTYVYKCDNDHTFEVMQSMAEDPLDTCEVCGAPARRQLFAPAVHFKGSGFYATDYARKGASKNGSGEGAGDSKTEKKSDSSKSSDSSSGSGSDSKTESKAASSKD